MAIDPISALGAIGAILKIIDSVTGQWDRYFKKKTEAETAAAHRVTTEQVAPGTIVIRDRGRDVETITAADLATLDPNSRALIKALEDSMQRHFEIWTAVYPTRDSSPDPVVNAQIDRRLKDIAMTMCQDLGKIFGYLDSIHKYLEDHYENVRFLCGDLQPPQSER